MIEVGERIAKEFTDDSGKCLGLFRGRVVSIDDDDPDDVLYRVVYKDGDFEDMDEDECRIVIELYQKVESGEINEWEIGGDE